MYISSEGELTASTSRTLTTASSKNTFCRVKGRFLITLSSYNTGFNIKHLNSTQKVVSCLHTSLGMNKIHIKIIYIQYVFLGLHIITSPHTFKAPSINLNSQLTKTLQQVYIMTSINEEKRIYIIIKTENPVQF